jgi:hypothetical protein
MQKLAHIKRVMFMIIILVSSPSADKKFTAFPSSLS